MFQSIFEGHQPGPCWSVQFANWLPTLQRLQSLSKLQLCSWTMKSQFVFECPCLLVILVTVLWSIYVLTNDLFAFRHFLLDSSRVFDNYCAFRWRQPSWKLYRVTQLCLWELQCFCLLAYNLRISEILEIERQASVGAFPTSWFAALCCRICCCNAANCCFNSATSGAKSVLFGVFINGCSSNGASSFLVPLRSTKSCYWTAIEVSPT